MKSWKNLDHWGSWRPREGKPLFYVDNWGTVRSELWMGIQNNDDNERHYKQSNVFETEEKAKDSELFISIVKQRVVEFVGQYVNGEITAEKLSKEMSEFDDADIFKRLPTDFVAVIDSASDIKYLKDSGNPESAEALFKSFYKDSLAK